MILEGIIDQVVGQKSDKTWTLTTFKLIDAAGKTYTVKTFEAWNDEHIGESVKIEVEYSQKYHNYTMVKGSKIVTVGVSELPPVVAAPVVEEPKKTRIRRDTAPAPVAEEAPAPKSYESNPPAPSEAVGAEREDFRQAAIDAVRMNLVAARELAATLQLNVTNVADLVALSDNIGRTQTAIFMDSKKDARTASINKKSWNKKSWGRK